MPSALIRWQVASASGRLSPATKRADKRLAQPEVSIHFRKCFWRERNRKNVRMLAALSLPIGRYACPAGTSSIEAFLDAGWQRRVEIVRYGKLAGRPAESPVTRRFRGRNQAGDRLAGPSDRDLFSQRDPLQQLGKMRFGFNQVGFHMQRLWLNRHATVKSR
jgi:hypothetical protein